MAILKQKRGHVGEGRDKETRGFSKEGVRLGKRQASNKLGKSVKKSNSSTLNYLEGGWQTHGHAKIRPCQTVRLRSKYLKKVKGGGKSGGKRRVDGRFVYWEGNYGSGHSPNP